MNYYDLHKPKWQDYYNPVRKAQIEANNSILATLQQIDNNRDKKKDTSKDSTTSSTETSSKSPGWGTLIGLASTNGTQNNIAHSNTYSPTSSGPRGIRNNNWLNIRLSAANNWQGEIAGNDKAFETFSAPEYGIRAAAKLVTNYYDSGLDTVDKIISKWAPSSENDTQNYINIVASRMNIDPNKKIDVKDPKVMENLLSAMTFVENGQEGDRNVIRKGIQLNV